MPEETTNAEITSRIQASFDRQVFMKTVGARLVSVGSGQVTIEWPFRSELTQQHGFLHAGVVAAVVDSACGYAALTMMPPDAAVLSVEFKVNLLKPAAGTHFRAIGKVIRAGRTLTVCGGEVHAHLDGKDSVIAIMQATMMAVRDSNGLVD